MKRFTLLLLLPISFFLFGCPGTLDYPAEEMGKYKLDYGLIGHWLLEGTDHEVLEMEVSDAGNNLYQIDVLSRGEQYGLETNSLKGWVTKIGEYTILIVKPDNENKYLHYVYWYGDGGNIYLADVQLLVGGLDVVTSTEKLREEILASSKLDNFIQDEVKYYRQ